MFLAAVHFALRSLGIALWLDSVRLSLWVLALYHKKYCSEDVNFSINSEFSPPLSSPSPLLSLLVTSRFQIQLSSLSALQSIFTLNTHRFYHLIFIISHPHSHSHPPSSHHFIAMAARYPSPSYSGSERSSSSAYNSSRTSDAYPSPGRDFKQSYGDARQYHHKSAAKNSAPYQPLTPPTSPPTASRGATAFYPALFTPSDYEDEVVVPAPRPTRDDPAVTFARHQKQYPVETVVASGRSYSHAGEVPQQYVFRNGSQYAPKVCTFFTF